jgi:hypothetical protein
MTFDFMALLDPLTGGLETARLLGEGDAIKVSSVFESSGDSSFGDLGVAVPD